MASKKRKKTVEHVEDMMYVAVHDLFYNDNATLKQIQHGYDYAINRIKQDVENMKERLK